MTELVRDHVKADVDKHPVIVSEEVFNKIFPRGYEPSLRELVYKYYAAHLDNEEAAVKAARDYLWAVCSDD